MRWLLPVAGLMACAESESSGVVPDMPTPFALEDVNPTSPSFGELISTDGYSSRTAWYFGHAT